MLFIIIFIIGCYFLIGALLFLSLLFKVCKINNLKFSQVKKFGFTVTTNKRKYEGMDALILFLFKWPTCLNIIKDM